MKLNVGVFFGGESVEHEVSIITGHQAIAALDKEKYDVIPIYVAKDRRLFTSPLLIGMRNYRTLDHLITQCTQITLAQEDNQVVIKPVKTTLFGKKVLGTLDVAILAMHGTNGEDGTIQGYLEMLKLPYAGCDVISAAVGQDKVLQKHILHDNGFPLTNWFWVYGHEMDEHPDEILRKAHKLIYPVIVKPACTGSSVGISVAHNDEEYLEAFEEARQHDFKVITEKVVKPLREINASVLGDCFSARVSVLEEVGSDKDLLDFKDKYQSNTKGASEGMASTRRIVPAPLDEATTEYIQKLALDAFRILGASGVCRIDFLMDAETKTVFMNEINTIPGSLAFYLWKESGLSFTELMDELVRIALDRKRRRDRMTFSYDTNLLETYNDGGAKGMKK